MEKKQIAVLGHERVPLHVIEKLEREGYEIVEPPEGFEVPKQGRPLDFHAGSYLDTVMPIYNTIYDLPSIYDRTTTNGDLKRCKKGIHNYGAEGCIYCKRLLTK